MALFVVYYDKTTTPFHQGTKDETDKDEEEEPAATTGTHLQPTTSSQDTTRTQEGYLICLFVHNLLTITSYSDAEEEDEGEKKQEEEEEEEDQKKTEDQEVVVVEEMVIEEECEPPRPSLLKRAMTSFRKKIAILFVFTINRERRVGLFLRVLGSVLAFLSCFTITYQVCLLLIHLVATYTCLPINDLLDYCGITGHLNNIM